MLKMYLPVLPDGGGGGCTTLPGSNWLSSHTEATDSSDGEEAGAE